MEVTEVAEKAKRANNQARDLLILTEERSKTDLDQQGMAIMEYVANFEEQNEPLDKVSRYIRDSFRTMQQAVTQDRIETDKEFSSFSNDQILQLKQMIETEHQVTDTQYKQLSNNISVQVVELQK